MKKKKIYINEKYGNICLSALRQKKKDKTI